MFDTIKDHALQNVWCSPDQDKQFVFRPARISRGAGVKNKIKVMWDVFDLPTKNDKYHVYQVGQIHPMIIGIMDNVYQWHSNPSSPAGTDQYSENNKWLSIATLCNNNNLVVDLYINSGLQFPRHTSYVLVTDDRNLIIAVKDQPLIKPHLNLEHFFIRLYSNAFFQSVRSNDFAHQIYVEGRIVISPSDIVAFNNQIQAMTNVRGACFIYVNGLLVNELTVLTATTGDLVEFYYDSTVRRIIEIPLRDMQTFDSTMDVKRKYLLTYPESDQDDLIDFYDDIDFYLTYKTFPLVDLNRFKGCYYHKNWADSVRMITHKDYSLPVAYVQGYVDDHSFFISSNDIVVRMYVRDSGYDRTLMNENNRIKELYKLSDTQVTEAMVGTNATLVNWRAETLENSDYPRIMRSKSSALTKLMVQDGYGYNAIAKIIADTPQPVETVEAIRMVNLPVGLQINSTICEYDIDGLLLGHYTHSNDVNYFPHSLDCEYIEGVMGLPTQWANAGKTSNQQTVTLDPNLSYRMYKTRIIGAVIQEQDWEDVTGTLDYIVVGNTLNWAIDLDLYYVCVKSDQYNLVFDHSVFLTNNVLTFNVEAPTDEPGPVLYIPPGKLDIWMNGNYLIENLDYYITWPQVIIVNKEYLILDEYGIGEQDITVRGSGFCNADMSMETAAEYGFVINQVLSRNTIFDIRDDKVIHIAVEGKLKLRSQLDFSEDNPGITIGGVRNGAPYVIKDVIVPMRDATVDDTYVLRERSRVIDHAVSDYLTQYIGQAVDPLPNVIPYLHKVYSPFASILIYDLINGILLLPGIEGHYSEMDMRGWLASYEWILEFDPCRYTVSTDYVDIRVHPFDFTLELNYVQYAFMERVITFYLHNKIDLSDQVTMRIV